MKPLISLTIASTKRFLRNKSTLVFSLFIPLALIMVFGAFVNQAPSKIDLGIVDQASNNLSENFINILNKTSAFKIEKNGLNTLQDQIDNGKKDLVIVIPKNFGTPGLDIQLLNNINKQQQAQIGKQIITQVIDSSINFPGINRKVNIVEKTINSKNLTIIDFLVPGLIAQSIMQLGIFGVAFAFVSQKATGVLKRLLATPIKATNIIIAESFARIIVSVIQIAIMIGVSIFLYKLQIVGNLFIVLLFALMGIIIFQSIGFAIAGYAKDENQVAPLAQIISLPMMLLSGVFFSRDVFPNWLKTITDFFPLTYLADGMRETMNNGAGLDVIGKDFIGLAVWMIIAFLIAFKFFKWE